MRYTYRIEEAIRAAAMLHSAQTRKGSVPYPYVTHLYAVAFLVADYTEEEDTIIAALLHDTIEDTGYTLSELEEDFGKKVKDIVVSITEPREKDNGSEPYQIWKKQKKAYLAQLRTASEAALIVAAADKIHNLRSIIEDYYERIDDFVNDFGGTLEDRVVFYQEISNIINRKLHNDILHEFNHVFDEYRQFIEHAKKEIKK